MNKLTDDFFYGRSYLDKFHITEIDIEKVQKLKSRVSKSGYYKYMVEWHLSDNPHISDEIEINRLWVVMQFISMSADVKEIKSIELKKYHISLLRQLYLEYDDYRDDETLGEFKIRMGYKRPFGNSSVLSNVGDEISLVDPNFDRNSDNQSFEESVLKEFSIFLDEFFRGSFELKFNHFFRLGPMWGASRAYLNKSKNVTTYDWNIKRPHSYLSYWSPDINEIRESKINKLFENEIPR
jgi:hypothetical protein